MTNKAKVEKIQDILNDYEFDGAVHSSSEVYVALKDMTLWDIAETISGLASCISEIMDVVEE